MQGWAARLAACAVLVAACGTTEPTRISMQAAGYLQDDQGGNENIDEDASVVEAIILIDSPLTTRDSLKTKIVLDVVSSASMTRNHNPRYRSLQSGASGVVHYGQGFSWTHKGDNWESDVGIKAAFEYAYLSFGLIGGLTYYLDEKNTALSVGMQGFVDSVRMIRFNGDDEPNEARTTFTTNLGWGQVLTPDSRLQLSGTLSVQAGFLAGQFNSVFVNGVEDFEILPSDRLRGSVTGRYKHSVGAFDAVELGLRGYTDSWNVQALTGELKYFLHFDPMTMLVMHYRYHVQSAADGYQPVFAAALPLQTSDPDLGDFDGHMGSLTMRLLEGFNDDSLSLSFGLNAYLRSNKLQMYWLSFGIGFDT